MIRVLIVEDEPPILRMEKSLIEKINPEFCVSGYAMDGEEAVRLLNKGRYDVIFTDIRMPVMDGLELLEFAHKRFPLIYTVLLTGYQEFDYAKQALKNQAYDYLLKPISAEVLSPLLKKLEASFRKRNQDEKKKQFSKTINKSQYEFSEMCICDDEIKYAVMLMCAGPFLSYAGDFLSLGLAFWDDMNLDGIIQEVLDGRDGYWTFQGETLADRIVIMELPSFHKLRDIVDTVFKRIAGPGGIPVTIVSCSGPVSFHQIGKTFKLLRRKLCSESRIGCSSVIWVNNVETTEKDVSLPERYNEKNAYSIADKIVASLKSTDKKSIEENLRNALLFMSGNNWTQFEVLKFFEKVLEKCTRDLPEPLKSGCLECRMDIIECISNAVNYESLFENMFFIFKSFITRAAQTLNEKNRKPLVVDNIEAYLRNNYMKSITNQTLAQEFNFVPSYLSHLFREYTGLSPSEYLVNIRMEKAKALLKNNPDIMIKEVADMVGFKNQYHFSKTFKRQTGVWPTGYRM